MPDVLVRNVDLKLLKQLKARARRNGRSLQTEVKWILEQSAHGPSMEDFRKAALRIRGKLAHRRHGNSTALIREDRER